MSVKIDIRGEVEILAIDSRLVSADHVRELVDAVKHGIDQGVRKFVVDMSGADWINSAGISALINSYRHAQDVEGNLVLAKVNAKVEQILVITKLSRIFKRYPTIEVAIKALG